MTPDDPNWNDDAIIAEYIGAFSARQDLFVKNGAAVFRQPLDPPVIRHAIEHHYSVSGYLGAPDGRTHVGAIDFDTTDGFVRAKDIQHFLDQHQIPSLLVQSRRGAHLWITSWDWVSTGEMRRAIRSAVALVLGAEAVEDEKVERMPKAGDDLAVGSLRLPGLPHQKDQQAYPIYDMRGEVEPTFLSVLEFHTLTTPEAIRRLAGAGPKVTPEYPKGLGGFYGYREQRDFGPEPSASEVLSAWGVQIRPGGTGRCPKHDDKHGSLTVFRDDKRVFCGAPHCSLNGSGHGVGSVMLSRMAAPG
jgi:hypothetical protein